MSSAVCAAAPFFPVEPAFHWESVAVDAKEPIMLLVMGKASFKLPDAVSIKEIRERHPAINYQR
ncbi:hypothetical protein [Azospirillum doebereinerae]